jgi:DNA-directed RNA polymerase specialized sigma24 family protein
VGTRRKDWTLAQESFDRLLSLLDSDRDRAGLQYERLRQRLTKLFAWRGCAIPDEYVDKTLDRVAARVGDGTELRDPYAYCHAVALNLLHEYRREPSSGWRSLSGDSSGDLPPASAHLAISFPDPDSDQRLECLDHCLQALPPETRQLLFKYHEQRGRARQQLADQLGVPVNALRIRMFRARVALEKCVVACLERAAADGSRKYPSGI